MENFEINALNIGSALPEEVLEFFHERYKKLELPMEALTPYDLAYVESMMGYIANEHSYLNYMYLIVSIDTRNAKLSKNRELSDETMSKKNILKAFLDELDNMNKTLSRMVTIYSLSKAETAAEDRVANAQKEETEGFS